VPPGRHHGNSPPKPQTSAAKPDGRFSKQEFVYLPEEDAYRCAAGEQRPYRFTSEEDGSGYGATGSPQPVKIVRLNGSARQGQSGGFRDRSMITYSKVCSSAFANPQAMRQRRETVEHPFATTKARMGATHFLTKTLPKVATEMALSVLAYNVTRGMNIVGTKPLMAAIVA
jgi:hypothetical protein